MKRKEVNSKETSSQWRRINHAHLGNIEGRTHSGVLLKPPRGKMITGGLFQFTKSLYKGKGPKKRRAWGQRETSGREQTRTQDNWLKLGRAGRRGDL